MADDSAASRLAAKGIPLIIIAGPTASGKTSLAIELAGRFSGEIISVDSMQVYRRMDIGTAKPTPEEQAQTPHHLIDIVNPDQEYNLARFIEDAEPACEEVASRSRIPIMAGGTGMYIRGFISGIFELDQGLTPKILAAREELKKELSQKGEGRLYQRLVRIDPQSAERIHPNDTSRLIRALEIYDATGRPWSEHLAEANRSRNGENVLKIGLLCDREKLYQRIDARVDQMLALGFREEVEDLLAAGYSRELKSMQSIGYQHMCAHILDQIDLATTRKKMARDTRRYAKRQLTWFGREDSMEWFPPEDIAAIAGRIGVFLASFNNKAK